MLRAGTIFASLAAALLSCGGGGGSSSSSASSIPSAPSTITAIADDGSIRLSWSAVSGASSYSVYWGNAPGVSTSSSTRIAGVSSPMDHSSLTNGQTYYYAVTASNSAGESTLSAEASATPVAAAGSRYDPSWGSLTPAQTISFSYDAGRSSAQNGQDLANVIDALASGDKLTVGAGSYTLPADYAIRLQGNSSAPIWIVAATSASVTLTRADSAGPVIGIGGQGSQSASQYLVLQGFEITGGGVGVAIHKADHIWVNRCHVHDTGGAGIRVSTEDADHLHITRNEVHDTTSWGEGIRLGDESLGAVAHHCVVALNHVHDTRAALQGDGIELQQNCYANWIAENVVHHTKYPAILFHGTGGQAVNTIESNICYDSQDNVMQAEAGEAIVRNNVLVGPAGNKVFDSTHSEATLRDLTVVHNTMIAQAGYAAGLFGWNGQPGLVFANNAVYSHNWGPSTYAIAYRSGYAGGTLAGNVVLGNLQNGASGATQGTGLTDFANVSGWSYAFSSLADLAPSTGSALIEVGNSSYAATEDILGNTRTPPVDVGAIEVSP